MKKLIIAAALATPLAAIAQAENYVIDPFHTVPYFEVDHLQTATMRGRFDRATGKFSIDRAAKTGSVELEIPTATVNTGDSDRAGRPRTRDNVQEFPTMTFKSTKVVFKGDEPASVEGNLTMLGVTKPVTLNLDRWKCGPDIRTQGKRYQCGGNATGSFKRSDFGMKFGLPNAVGDEVKLWMSFYGFKQ